LGSGTDPLLNRYVIIWLLNFSELSNLEGEDDYKEVRENEMKETSQLEAPENENDVISLKAQVDALKRELDKTSEASNANINKLKYMMADFDNYRKQMEKHLVSKIETSKADLLLKFLNIKDDFLRAVEMAKQSGSEPVVIEGLEGISRNFDNVLNSEGVLEIETVSTPFDPNIHDALGFSDRDDLPENTVTTEIRKGYLLGNKVLRPALVEISKKIVKNTVNDRENIEKETEN
jgi:molecular chaperone GrpE